MKIKHIAVVFVLLFVVSCSSEATKKADSTAHADANKGMKVLEDNTPDFTLDEYVGFPDGIEGCSCYFSENEEKLGGQQFLFTSNPDGLAIVRISKKELRLKQVATPRYMEPANADESIEMYEGEGYTVTLHTTGKVRSGDEVWTHKGTITVEKKDGKKLVKEFTGECGC